MYILLLDHTTKAGKNMEQNGMQLD